MPIHEKIVSQARNEVSEVQQNQLNDFSNALMLDVREPYEFEKGAIPNSINIPRGRLEFDIEDHKEVKKITKGNNLLDEKILIYCKTSGRAVLAAKSLKQIGFTDVHSLIGGYDEWIKLNKSS